MLIQKKDVFNRTRRQIAQGGAARNCTISKTLPPPGMLARRVCDGTAKQAETFMISGEKARQIADVEVAARHLGIGISEVVLYDAIMG